jgi:hypothetical protein
VKKLLSLILLLAPLSAFAQQMWNENRLSWESPTTCQSGQPIGACPISNYRVERAASATGAFAALGTSQTTTYTHLSAAAGTNCYRVIAVAVTGESPPSNVACKTNTQPAGPPNPPTNLQFVTTLVNGNRDTPAVPAYRILDPYGTPRKGELFALVPPGRVTEKGPAFKYRGQDYCLVFVKEKELTGTKDPNWLAATCAPRA